MRDQASNRKVPNREEVAKRTLERVKKFTETVESGARIDESYTCRKVILDVVVEPYTAKEVKETRAILNVSQALFAGFLNVSVSAVQKWERGAQPDGAACRLMDEIRTDPEYWKKRFRSMTRTVSGATK